MNKTISLRIPGSYHHMIKKISRDDNVSINQWITSAIGEKLSALDTEDYIATRAARASRESFDAALSLVPDIEPEQHDRVEAKR